MSDAVTAKKHKIEMSRAMSSDVVRNADDCVKALERAMELTHPPLNVFAGVLRLIAEYVPYLRFDIGGGLAGFNVSDDGATATRNSSDDYYWPIIFASPILSEGVHEITARVNYNYFPFAFMITHNFAMGIVAISNASSTGRDHGYTLFDDGRYRTKSSAPHAKYDACEWFDLDYAEGDTITVRLDLEANTIAFRSNVDQTIVPPQPIDHDEYYFYFKAEREGVAVTLTKFE